MTKSTTERKRVRRAPSGAGRDPSDNRSKQLVSKKDAYQVFSEKVRDNKQLKSKWAIMQETRVEYFRGKDFPVFLKDHLEVKEVLGEDKDLDAEDIINALLRKNLIVRCDRAVKTLRPGKKKLSSWPVHLEIHNHDVNGKTYYTFEFIAQAPNFTRHALGAIAIANGKFYTLTTGANERRWEKMKDRLHTVVDSFKIVNA